MEPREKSYTLEDLFKIIKRESFVKEHTKINPTAGFNHRITGKGTNPSDKKNTQVTLEDMKEIRKGVKKLILYLQRWSIENEI